MAAGASRAAEWFPGWSAWAYWLVAAWLALADTLAGLLHELGHAAVALAHGRRVYRITLYGFAAAARRSAGRGAHEQLLTALSGPLSHLLLAALFWTIWRVASADNVPRRVAFPAATNLLVGVLNLRPLRPLDGRLGYWLGSGSNQRGSCASSTRANRLACGALPGSPTEAGDSAQPRRSSRGRPIGLLRRTCR